MENLARIIEQPLAKKEVIALAKAEADGILEAADRAVLPIVIEAKRIIDFLEAVTETLKEEALNEALKYPSKGFKAHGAKIQVKENGAKTHYESCKDPVWDDLDNQIKVLTAKKKEREAFLSALKSPMTVVEEETGETYPIFPPRKSSTTGIAIQY